MDDLVVRLRRWAVGLDLQLEAADEIEQLRKENKRLRKCVTEEWDGVAAAKILEDTEAREEELAQLRGAALVVCLSWEDYGDVGAVHFAALRDAIRGGERDAKASDNNPATKVPRD